MDVILPRLHAAQREVVDGAARFNALCCGRRWGKTTIGIDRMVPEALAGKPVAWFAPTYRTLLAPFREMVEVFAPVTKRKNESEHRLELVTGGVVEAWTLDSPDAGRGNAYAQVVIDEAAMVPQLESAWEQSIRPMLSDYQGGAWFLSTPKGTANYFYRLFQRGQNGREWRSWQRPTTTNPFIAADEIAAAREDMTDLAYAQEYLAQFVTWGGSVFRRIMDAVTPINQTPAAIIGVDWGRFNDFTVFVALSAGGAVLEIDRFRGIEYTLQRGRLVEFWRRHGARCWIMAEANSMGGPVVEQLQRDGLPVCPFLTTGPSKAAIIETLALAFERGRIQIPNDPALIGELQAFESRRLPSGFLQYGAPAGQHDDTVMGLAFAWHGLTAPRTEIQYWDPRTGQVTDDYRPYTISPI